MTSKNLVTTANESTWPQKGKVLFLGKWCCSFSRRTKWSSINFEIATYHWDDRQKLHEDYKDLEKLYEIYLDEFVDKLNKIHKKRFSKKFWRILIGPWLYTCIQVLFDRWYMLNDTISKHNDLNVLLFNNELETLLTNDIDAFNIAIEEDSWNEALYGVIIEKFFSDKVKINYLKNNTYKNLKPSSRKKPSFLKLSIIKLLNLFSRIFSRSLNYFIIAPHLSFYNQLRLNLKLNQFPAIWYKDSPRIVFLKDFIKREDLALSSLPGIKKEFENVINSILFKLIPKVYLEGFDSLEKNSINNSWPKLPDAIFTSNSYASDEVFKCWCGQKVEQGSRLVIGQHGGNFGMTPMAIHETHQIDISDKWLSWGWENKKESKIIPIGNFKSHKKKIRYKSDGDALLVSMTLPKYSYYLYSVPIAGQVEEYLEDQFSFFDALPEHIQNKIRIRLYQVDRDWNQKERWDSRFSNINFDSNDKSLLNSLKNSRIFIGTYNATTYLEAFSLNIPSILFWNPYHWELDDQALIFFRKLEDVGIFHKTPFSAARHLERIWDDIDSWWNSDQVQEAVFNFNSRYSKNNPNVINEIVNQLKSTK